MVVRHGRHRLHEGVPGAELLGLQRPADRRFGQRRADLLAAMAVDHVDGVGRERLRAVDDVLQQRSAGQRLQHLGQVALHALALAGGQDDDGQRHAASLPGVDAGF